MRKIVDTNPKIYRFSERSFRRYEAVIKRATDCFPDPVIVRLSASKPSTFCLRCRDAIRSYINNFWESTINRERLEQILDDFFVDVVEEPSGDAAEVRVGPRIAYTKKIYVDEELPPAVLLGTSSRVALESKSPTDEELTALMVLANVTFFNNIPVLVKDVSSEQQAYIETGEYLNRFPNVVFDKLDGSTSSFKML